MPGCDGSALEFVRRSTRVGNIEQASEVSGSKYSETCGTLWRAWIEARPSHSGEYTVQFELDYPRDSVIGRQTASCESHPEEFRREIAPCRTFVLQREADDMVRRGWEPR